MNRSRNRDKKIELHIELSTYFRRLYNIMVIFEVCKGASTFIYKFGIITVIEMMMMIMMTMIILKIIYVLCISCSFSCLNGI